MNDAQKSKRKFGQTKRWKEFKQKMKTEAGKVDAITGKKLYRSWQLHHQNLNDYYQKDEGIIDRLKAEMLKMKEINGGRK